MDDPAAFFLDVLAHGGLGETKPAPAPAVPWSAVVDGPDLDQIRRTELRETGLSSGRICRWTRMTGRELSRAWSARFEDNAEVARDAAMWAAERLIRGKLIGSQERLFAVKRVFLGIHARTQLDARREQRGLDAVWPLDVIDEDAQRLLPLPLKGLLRLLEYAAWKRARIPACRLRPSR